MPEEINVEKAEQDLKKLYKFLDLIEPAIKESFNECEYSNRIEWRKGRWNFPEIMGVWYEETIGKNVVILLQYEPSIITHEKRIIIYAENNVWDDHLIQLSKGPKLIRIWDNKELKSLKIPLSIVQEILKNHSTNLLKEILVDLNNSLQEGIRYLREIDVNNIQRKEEIKLNKNQQKLYDL